MQKGSVTYMDDPLSCILIIGLCIILHFFFSISETALACVNRFKMQIKADEGHHSAKLVLKVCDNYDRALTSVLIGSNIVAIVASAVSTVAFYDLLSNTGWVNETISLVSSIIITFLIYIFGDSLPKTIARSIPDTISQIVIFPIYFFTLILFPISILFELLAKLVEKIFKVKEEEDFDEEDFENIVEKVSDEGIIEEEQEEIIHSALDFVDTNVKEVLTPREKIFGLDIKNLTYDSINKIIIENNYSRIPVFDHSLDKILGVLVIKNYLDEYNKDSHVDLRSLLQKPYFVSSSIMIDDLFNGFKKNRTHIAFVHNKNKKIIGMVTMDDVLEELVSDISEERKHK